MEIEAETIDVLWRALQRPHPTSTRRSIALDERIIDNGWASNCDIEDYITYQDCRLGDLTRQHIKSLTNALGLPFRSVFPRPSRRHDEDFGSKMLSSTDFVALCILLERIGFQIDVSRVCEQIRCNMADRIYLTEQEISAIFYNEDRHRMPELTLHAARGQIFHVSKSKIRTSHGYRIEFASDETGRALWLTSRSPKFRKRPATVSATCSDCGMTYVKGTRTEEQLHRSVHRQWSSTVKPKSHRRLSQALQLDLDAAWVDWRSPKWKRKEVYDRAREFKHEFRYDFLQWSLDANHDTAAIGFLFSDEGGRIVGACCFRPQIDAIARPWRLDWIWICPDARRLGHLDRQWDRFEQRFGIFEVEPPVSEAMQIFLRKRGLLEAMSSELKPSNLPTSSP